MNQTQSEILITEEFLSELRTTYNTKAIKEKQTQFTCCGLEFSSDYAKYLLEYWEPKFSNQITA